MDRRNLILKLNRTDMAKYWHSDNSSINFSTTVPIPLTVSEDANCEDGILSLHWEDCSPVILVDSVLDRVCLPDPLSSKSLNGKTFHLINVTDQRVELVAPNGILFNRLVALHGQRQIQLMPNAMYTFVFVKTRSICKWFFSWS